MKHTLLILSLLLIMAENMWAQEFTINNLTYSVIDAVNKKIEVCDCEQTATAVIIPANVTYDNTEYNVTSIGDYAFEFCELTQINIPNSVTSIGEGAFYPCFALTAINVENDNTYYCSENGILFDKDKTKLIQYPAGKTETSYEIPNSVTSIEHYAFYYCFSLTNINIPNSITSIGHLAFSCCSSLTKINIPNGVTSIGNYTFDCCLSLTNINIPSSVTFIGFGAFRDCSALKEMTILATTPPMVSYDSFDGISHDIPVYVPAEALADYKVAEVWNELNLQPISGTNIEILSASESISVYDGMLHNPQGRHIDIYDMQGRRMYSGSAIAISQPSGIYVVHCEGKSHKVQF